MQLAIAADDPVAGDEKHQRIVRQGVTDCANGIWFTDLGGNFAIGARLTPRDQSDRCQDFLLEWR